MSSTGLVVFLYRLHAEVKLLLEKDLKSIDSTVKRSFETIGTFLKSVYSKPSRR